MAEQSIIVMSDSHGDRDIVEDIKKRYQGKVDAIFHNGDSELESSDPVWDGIYVVRGNCDYDSGYPERLVVKLGDVVIAQTHGHLYGINFTWDKLDLRHNKRTLIFVFMGICMQQQLGETVKLYLSIQDLFRSHEGLSMLSFMLRCL